MFKLSILLLTVTLATSSAYYSKKQAVYPNSGSQTILSAAQQHVPVGDQNSQLQQVQVHEHDTLARSALPAQSQQQPQQQQLQQSAQPTVYASGQQQAQSYPFVKQFPYYPQQIYPQQPIYPAGTGPQTVYLFNQRYPTINDGFDQGNGGLYGTGGSWFPPSIQWPPNYPSFPAQVPQFPPGWPGAGSQPLYPPSNGIGNYPAGGSTNGPDSVVTTASGNSAEAPSAAEGNSVVLVGGNRPKPEKVEVPPQDLQKSDAAQQQYVFVPQQQQVYGHSSGGQTEREISQLNSPAKGAISSYLIYKDAASRFPQQQFVQQLVPQQQGVPQQIILPQQVAPQQILIPQQVAGQQAGPQQLQPQASANSLIAQQISPQQLNGQQLDSQLAIQQFIQQQQQPTFIQQQSQQQQFAPPQQLVSQQQFIPQQQLIAQPQLIPQQGVPQEQGGAPQFINQFVPSQQKPSDATGSQLSQESASLAYQRFLLQSKQRAEEPSFKSGLRVEESYPVSESPAVTTNSVEIDNSRSSGSA